MKTSAFLFLSILLITHAGTFCVGWHLRGMRATDPVGIPSPVCSLEYRTVTVKEKPLSFSF